MDDTRTNERMPAPYFRRAIGTLRSQARILIVALIAAVGVSVFYTFSLSSAVPLLKVIFAEHETLADWLNRTDVESRLGVKLPDDLPDDPAGLRIDAVSVSSVNEGVLETGDRIIGLNGERLSSRELVEQIAHTKGDDPLTVTLRRYDRIPTEVQVQLELGSERAGAAILRHFVGYLPAGRDADARMRTLLIVIGLLVFVSLVGNTFRVVNDGLVALAVQRAMHGLRTRLAAHVFRLPLAWHQNHPPGDLQARFANDVRKIEVGMTTLFGKVIREPLKAIGVLTLTVLIEWRLLVVALIGLPIGAFAIRFFGRAVKRAQKRASASWGRLLEHLGEKVAGIKVVKAYSAETRETNAFTDEDALLTREQAHIEVVDAATKPVLETLAIIAVAAFILYGGNRVFNHTLEPHLFFAAVVCLGGVFDPVRKLGNVNNRIQAADAAAQRIYELLDLTVERANGHADRGVDLPPLRESITVQDVTFAYAGHEDRPALQSVDLAIHHGEVIAIVGPNGCGKTTLTSLLLRFYEPQQGRILFDDVDIADASLASLRKQIGLVVQETVVFSASVRENIAYGREVGDAQIIDAARNAHAAEFIERLRVQDNGHIRAGYDALISARTLSGGQRQRLALARAIIGDPALLILDEATSQIDSESEQQIAAALDDVTRGRTTIIIAHRYSTIARADRIVVMNEGRIVDVGRHDELLARCAFYANLCETQLTHAS